MAPNISEITALVAAGGTGGHFFPAAATLDKISELTGRKVRAVFVGRKDKIEFEAAPKLGFEFREIPMRGFAGLFSPDTLRLPFRTLKSMAICRGIIKEIKPNFCLCAGAYLSLPAGLVASRRRVPMFLMESNVFPGKAIRLLSPRADLIFASYEESFKYFPINIHGKIKVPGNPIRRDILSPPDRATASEKFGVNPETKTLLVFGGSLGAKSINAAVVSSMDRLFCSGFETIWQTGANFEAPKSLPASIKSFRFIDDMASAYAAADLVVSRSGATSVAEICAVGKPSILIPLSTASNDEQRSNARALVESGAAEMIEDSEIESRFFKAASEFINDDERLENAGKAAKTFAKPDAAEEIAKTILAEINF